MLRGEKSRRKCTNNYSSCNFSVLRLAGGWGGDPHQTSHRIEENPHLPTHFICLRGEHFYPKAAIPIREFMKSVPGDVDSNRGCGDESG